MVKILSIFVDFLENMNCTSNVKPFLYICNVKSTVKISSNFVAFLENMDFNSTRKTDISSYID